MGDGEEEGWDGEEGRLGGNTEWTVRPSRDIASHYTPSAAVSLSALLFPPHFSLSSVNGASRRGDK